jgi:hypothetical protein
MTLQTKINTFTKLGNFLNLFSSENIDLESLTICERIYYDKLMTQINQSVHYNGWFTKENILFAIHSWSKALFEENLKKWTDSYDFSHANSKTVGIVTAGNIPLVGMHDFISVLISEHKVLIKQSSNDQLLLPILANFLKCQEPDFENFIEFTDQKIENFDAIIATGSNNTARYFEAYFGKVPHIIRKNRNAVGVLTGNETEQQLEDFGTDIFQYFGLGCRSVSKIFIPKNYDLDLLFKAIFKYKNILDHNKYKNNYDYNKTVYLMSNQSLLENGFLVLKEDLGYASPISVLFYEYYDSLSLLKIKLESDKDQIQCVVSNGLIKDSVNFGQTQYPQLWDYADGVDTLEFLIGL